MPASRCGFKTKLLCSTPRRKRRPPMGSMTESTFATKDYGAVNLHRSAFISAIPRRSTDHPDSGYGSATEGCVDSLNGAASLEWPTPRTPGTPRSRAYGQKTHPRFRGRGVYPTEASCRFPLIVLQQTTQSFLATHNSVVPARPSMRQGEQQPVLLALVIALLVVMGHVLLQGSAQRSLPEQDQLRQAFLFHRSHPAFRIGVQIRTPGW